MRRRDNDRVELTGFPKFLHKFVRLITFPFRKPLVFVPLIILAYLIPTFIGAKPAEVHLWYAQKISGIFSSLKSKVEDTSKDIIPNSVKDLSKQTLDSLRGREDNSKKLADTSESDTQTVRRQMFERAQEANTPKTLDIMQEPDDIRAATAVSQEIVGGKGEPEVAPKAILQDSVKEQAQKKLDLIYLVTPQEFSGAAKVRNANELVIDGNTIFLFGIYAAPASPKGLEAKEHLQKVIGSGSVKCIVEAYTKQGYATGLCFANGISLNHDLVDKGFSKNVALER